MHKTKRFILGVTIFLIIYLTLFILGHNDKKDAYMEYLDYVKKESVLNEDLLSDILKNQISYFISDLFFLESVVLRNESQLDTVEQELERFIEFKKIYNKIEILDMSGHEIVKVDSDNNEFNYTRAVEDKRNQSYYKYLVNNSNSVYLSIVDMNKAYSHTNYQFQSSARVVKRIERGQNESFALVLDFTLEHILNLISEYNATSEGQIFVLDENGKCLNLNDKINSNYVHNNSDSISKLFDQFNLKEISKDGYVLTDNKLIFLVRKSKFDSNLFDRNVKIVDDMNIYFLQVFEIPEEYWWTTESNKVLLLYKEVVETPGFIIVSLILVYIFLNYVLGIRKSVNELKDKNEIDAITGIFSRSGGIEKIEYTLNNLEASSTHFLCFIDLDDFKYINDTFGHNEGDKALMNFSICVVKSIRKNDVFLRYGGDEFIIFLPDINKQIAEKVYSRIDYEIAKFNNNSKINIGYSKGCIKFKKNELSVLEAIKAADIKMYEAKKNKK